jgi:hypothetical protein
MSTITWITPKGNLGIVSESQFYSKILEAVDSDEQPLFYSFISGTLPSGMYVTTGGRLTGIPSLLTQVTQALTFSFTIRATNPNGQVSDRSFSLSVTNVNGPQFIPRPDLVGAYFDGSYLTYQFNAISDNPAAVNNFKIVNGSLPPGTTLSSTGLLSGFIGLIADNQPYITYESVGYEAVVLDPLVKSIDKFYNFTVQVTDGEKFDTVVVRVLIVSKGSYTADNLITLINNSFITIDADNKYRPIILNDVSIPLPTLISGSNFAYKFLAYDPEDEVVNWSIDSIAFSGMDDLDEPLVQSWNGASGAINVGDSTITPDGTVGPYTLLEVTLATRLVVNVNGTLLIANVGYSVSGNQITFVSPLLTSDLVEIQYISTNTGFDSILFDQGGSGLPPGLSINVDTGWVQGTLPIGQVEEEKTYGFRVEAYRKASPTYRSNKVTFYVTVKRTLNEEIIWETAEDLGSIDNGAVSELVVKARHTLGTEIQYSITYQPYRRIPQGLKVLSSGILTGRATFRFFSLDGDLARINVGNTSQLAVGMLVQGVGVASGCKITEIINSTTIEVQPAIYVAQGSILTFTDSEITTVLSTTTNAISTAIDGNDTTFDQKCQFTVKAETVDGATSSIKSFTVLVRPYNLAPYENLYLRALPTQEQRRGLTNILTDTTLIPQELIYRYDDPNFGVAKNFKILFLPGLSPAKLSQYVQAIERNHYTKNIDFGQIKTARAVDSNGNVAYEVVYVDAVDTQTYSTSGPGLSQVVDVTNNFLYNGNEFNTIYPNSFNNMTTRIEDSIGYSNRGALPRWMTSKQENGKVLGLTRAVVLAYTKPGSSKLIQYRLSTSAKLPAGNFTFVTDRYQLENFLSKFYDIDSNKFLPSLDTSFDRYPNLSTGDVVNTIIAETVTNSNVALIPEYVTVGTGWIVTGTDTSSTIDAGTSIVSISGNTLTLSKSITATSGSSIKIDGTARADYAVHNPFNSINGVSVEYARNHFLIDGVYAFSEGETMIFSQQSGYNTASDGWLDQNGNTLPGYLDKIGGASTVNKRSAIYQILFTSIEEIGFDSDLTGYDQPATGLYSSYFDQGSDNELQLQYVSEILLNQTVKIRTGKTYPSTTLVYRAIPGKSVPEFVVFEGTLASLETTFDGGSCSCREGSIFERRGGTAFSNNRDKYVIPESEDKYIKFPQDGVFV